ncbi:hypothetical protein [robinz microvirus RP_39]|nr:hypothetical protein [robinz microvirus RP_39]
MSKFSKYRPPGYKFYEPERVSPQTARENRLRAELQKNQKQQERFEKTLSRAPKKIDDPRPRARVKDQQQFGPKAASIAAALTAFKEADFTDPIKRKLYRDLRAQQNALMVNGSARGSKSTSGGGQGKSTAAGADRRYFNPSDPDKIGSTIYGTAAKLAEGLRGFAKVAPGYRYAAADKVTPCIQRAVRREVMLALGHGGAHKTKKGPKGIPC